MTISRAIRFFFLSLALFAFTLASSQEQPVQRSARVSKTEEQGGAKSGETKSANQPTQPNTPAAVTKAPLHIEQPIAHTKPDGEQKNEKREEGWWAKFVADPIAVFTGLLFFATLALWWATRHLVVGAEKSSERQLRAYISSRPDFIFDFSTKQHASMRYTIENHGETPAYSVQNVAIVDILPYPLPAQFQFPELPPLVPASLTLHPRERIFGNVTAQRLFTAKEINDAAANNGCRIYCFGIVMYESFGSVRVTKFCRSIAGSKNLLAVGSGGTKDEVRLDYEFASQHNDAN